MAADGNTVNTSRRFFLLASAAGGGLMLSGCVTASEDPTQGGAIVAKNDDAGTPAYIISGKIREAWNVQRDTAGVPSDTGTNGSAGPLGVVTSDETTVGGQLVTTFEHGKVAYNTTTGQVEVTVNGNSVPSGL